jgi:hypothetical protein
MLQFIGMIVGVWERVCPMNEVKACRDLLQWSSTGWTLTGETQHTRTDCEVPHGTVPNILSGANRGKKR